MRSVIVLSATLVLCLIQAAQADTIAEVKTLADLRKIPVIHTDSGYDVHIGIADPGADQGPCRAIYCLATATPGKEQMDSSDIQESSLGPVRVQLEAKDSQPVAYVRGGDRAFREGDRLFFKTLPIGWADGRFIRVYDDKRLLFETPPGKVDHRPFYWTHFASRPKSNEFVIDQNPWPACPGAHQTLPIGFNPPAGATTRPTIPEDEPLPGSFTLSDSWRSFLYPKSTGPLLNLSLEKGQFVIQSDQKILTVGHGGELLVRWWVNGKAVECAPESTNHTEQLSMLRKPESDRLAITFDLPKILGQLKAGDKVGLQVVWVDRAWHFTSKPLAEGFVRGFLESTWYGEGLPIPTNRLEFILDDHLLSLRSK